MLTSYGFGKGITKRMYNCDMIIVIVVFIFTIFFFLSIFPLYGRGGRAPQSSEIPYIFRACWWVEGERGERASHSSEIPDIVGLAAWAAPY